MLFFHVNAWQSVSLPNTQTLVLSVFTSNFHFVLYSCRVCRCFLRPTALDDIKTISSAYISKSKNTLSCSSTPDLFFLNSFCRSAVNRLKSKGSSYIPDIPLFDMGMIQILDSLTQDAAVLYRNTPTNQTDKQTSKRQTPECPALRTGAVG